MTASVSLREIYSVDVVDEQGVELGRIDDVLFHPILPYAVGFSVKMPRLGGVVKLPEKYLAFNAVTVNEEGNIQVVGSGKREKKAAWGDGATKASAIDWDDTVIYYGQTVLTQKMRTELGKVSDARFDMVTGEVSTLQVSDGISSDVMQGKRSFSGDLVKGFDLNAHALIVDEAAKNVPLEGSAKEAASEMADKALEATVKGAATATIYAEKGIKAVMKSDASKKTGSFFKKMASDFKEAYAQGKEEDM